MPQTDAAPDPARRAADLRLADEWEREYFGGLRFDTAVAGRAWKRDAFLAGLARGRGESRVLRDALRESLVIGHGQLKHKAHFLTCAVPFCEQGRALATPTGAPDAAE